MKYQIMVIVLSGLWMTSSIAAHAADEMVPAQEQAVAPHKPSNMRFFPLTPYISGQKAATGKTASNKLKLATAMNHRNARPKQNPEPVTEDNQQLLSIFSH